MNNEELEENKATETEESCCGGNTSCGCDHEAPADVEDLTDEEEMNLLEEIANLNDQLLRTKADQENFKRRLNEERIRDNKYRSQSLATSILPALDNFERALAAPTESEEVKNFLVGMEMVYNQFVEALANEGIETIKAEGEAFDPNFHQAVMQEEVEGFESGMVVMELQKGYKLKDRVIRPAMVKVSQ